MLVREVASLNEPEWSFYTGGQFNVGRMVMVQRWSVKWMVNGHVTEVARLMEGELPYYSLMEGEWLCYRGGHFNGGRMVMLQKWSL